MCKDLSPQLTPPLPQKLQLFDYHSRTVVDSTFLTTDLMKIQSSYVEIFWQRGFFCFFLRIFFAPSQKIYWIHFAFLISFWERHKTQYFKAEFWVIGRLSSFDMKLITIYLNCHSKYLVESPIFQFTRNSHNFLPLLRAMSLHSSHCKIKRKQRLSSATSPEMPLVAQLSLHSITTDPWSNIYATAKPTKAGTMTQPKCLSQQKQSCRY